MTATSGLPTTAVYPTKDDAGNVLTTEFGLCKYRDHQTISIQEMPENAPPGQLPRSVDIVLARSTARPAAHPALATCSGGAWRAGGRPGGHGEAGRPRVGDGHLQGAAGAVVQHDQRRVPRHGGGQLGAAAAARGAGPRVQAGGRARVQGAGAEERPEGAARAAGPQPGALHLRPHADQGGAHPAAAGRPREEPRERRPPARRHQLPHGAPPLSAVRAAARARAGAHRQAHLHAERRWATRLWPSRSCCVR